VKELEKLSYDGVTAQLEELYDSVQKLLKQVEAATDSNEKTDALQRITAVSKYLIEQM
jgi:hypothetical protein